MKTRILTLFVSTLLFQCAFAQYPLDSASTFSIELTTELCTVLPSYETAYKEVIDQEKGVRHISANGIPNHETGVFPNAGNPNTIRPQSQKYTVPLNPKIAERQTPGMGTSFGILFSGVELDPFTAEFFEGVNGTNHNWNITTLTSSVNLGLDCNNGHVQPSGKYHYHGTPNAYLEELSLDGSEMVKLGYAADGFPIYYKYGYDDQGNLIEMKSGYRLKTGERPGDGKSAPNGTYDGLYFQDYEYVEAASLLDACNGRWGKTPENEREYYYVITDNFPSSPICFSGTPSNDFRIGGGNAQRQDPRGGRGRQANGRNDKGHPGLEEMMQRADLNHDNQLSRSEVRGPLKDTFDQVDTDKNGFLSIEEMRKAGPPSGRPGRRP